MNKALMAEPCERIIWSGGGAEAAREEVIIKETVEPHSPRRHGYRP